MQQFGRRKILCDEPAVNAKNIIPILTNAMQVHSENKSACETLYQYFKGNQKILSRVKEIRPEINNKIVENRANEIVTFKTGYLCGEPLQYVSRSSKEKVSAEIGKLNDMMLLCDKAAHDKKLAEWIYICGVGCRIILPNSEHIQNNIIPKLENRETDFSEDEAPFEIYTLDPRESFVIYHSGLGEKPLAGVKCATRQDGTIIYSVYTKDFYYELSGSAVPDTLLKTEKYSKRAFKQIPIIEYSFNESRLGAFEIVMPLLDAINTVQSNRLDGIEQFIQSLTVLYNCDIDEEQAAALRSAGLVKLKSSGEQKADLKIMSENLDQSQTQTLVDYLYQTVLNIVGMPNRNGGSSTSDTGSAVIMRDGWEAAEARAKCDELSFKQSEQQLLKAALQIIRSTTGTDLLLSDVETKFTRRNYENIANKSQVLVTMLSNPKIHPLLAFTHCGMFSDSEAAYAMSDKYYTESQEDTSTNKAIGFNTDGGAVD